MPILAPRRIAAVQTSFRYALLLAAALLLPGCATMYVDSALHEVPRIDYSHPQPTQLLFSFQTKGTANAKATEFLKKEVTDTVTASGLFSGVSETPAGNGALLSVVINNVPVTDNAFGKGFATGLTFGLAGNTVTDGYICTVDYVAGTGKAKITKQMRHAIHTTVGAKGAPPNAIKAASPKEAVQTMARQVVANALKDLAADPMFGQ